MKGRILHLQKSAGIGGAEKHLTRLLPGLVKEGYEIHYLISEPKNAQHLNDPLILQLQEHGVTCHRIQMNYDLDPIALGKIFRKIRRIRPDILHTHLIQGDFYGALYKLLFPTTKLISTKHGYEESFQAKYDLNPEFLAQSKNIYYWLTLFSIRQSNQVIGISKGISRVLHAIPGSGEKIKTIWYGYESLRPYYIADEPKYFLYIGRLIPFKHPEILAEAYIQYRNSGGSLPLFIAGSGPSEAEMKQKLDASGVQHPITFLGRIPNPELLLPDAACLCVSSYSEGFGLVALEAMNAGIPVLAFDVPALNEIVIPEQTGFLCPKGSVPAFAQAMLDFERNPEMRKKMGEAGKLRLEKEFGLNRMVEAVGEIYLNTQQQIR
jgi:glycosyltransferase involved in cell wall biosynthesis